MPSVIQNPEFFPPIEEGYESDIDDKLLRFKQGFQRRLAGSAKVRVSRKNIPSNFRRLDAMARLLELDSICVAIYYCEMHNKLWIATNKIHGNSRAENAKLRKIANVFNFIANINLSVNDIIDGLTVIICDNAKQEEWRDIARLNINIEPYIKVWLEDLFQSGKPTREWKNEWQDRLKKSTPINRSFLIKLLKRTARLAKDLLKIKKSLLSQELLDPTSLLIFDAIREKRFQIIFAEDNGVHAEVKVAAKTLLQNQSTGAPLPSYIGISKLCCNHCGLMMDTFGFNTRGTHGQGANWPLPRIFKNNEHLESYLGEELADVYQQLPKPHQQQALSYIANKESSPNRNQNARNGRDMYADSSDSDTEFGVQESDDEIQEEIMECALQDVWLYRKLKDVYREEVGRLLGLGVQLIDILALYKKAEEKFLALSSLQSILFIEYHVDKFAIFRKLCGIYEVSNELFFEVISDLDNLIEEDKFNKERNQHLMQFRQQHERIFNSFREAAFPNSEDDEVHLDVVETEIGKINDAPVRKWSEQDDSEFLNDFERLSLQPRP